MFVVTFYSYKGGVGRTLSLVNSAVRLARRGKTVFILDFDLEAPGIDEFNLCPKGKTRAGIVEYMTQFATSGEVPPLANFVLKASSPELDPGQIFVMPAGNKGERQYQIDLSRLDWKHLYRRQKGFLFVENLKAAIEKEFQADYVLVDSRTGLTDVSGICTLQIPNLDVLIFNLNNQNVSGIAQIYRSIESNAIGRDIPTLLVASPIPDVPEELGIRKERFEFARKTIGANVDMILPYDPFISFKETILINHERQSPLSRAYDLLASEIIKRNKNDVLTMLDEAKKLVNQGTLELADLRFQEMVETKPRDFTAWMEYGRFQQVRGNWRLATEYFKNAYALKPGDPEVLSQLATTYLQQGDTDQATQYWYKFLEIGKSAKQIQLLADAFRRARRYEAAVKGYERAFSLAGNASAKLEIGNVYMALGKPGDAIAHYELAASAEPHLLPVVYNAGYALGLLRDARAVEYFQRAIELFEKTDPRPLTPTIRANQLQAISHAYVATGQLERARNALEGALQIATQMTKTMFFSSIQYREIPAPHFVAETMHLIKKLKTGGSDVQ